MSKKEEKDKKARGLLFFIYFVSFIVLAVIVYTMFFNEKAVEPLNNQFTTEDSLKKAKADEKYQADLLKASTSKDDSNFTIIRVSDTANLNVPYGIDNKAGKSIKRVFTGRRINIAITGLDNRIGTRSNHADANHVMSILIDSGLIEITSIPRDTPADAGMPDTSGQNKLTIVRSAKGREAYHKELATIAGLDKIHYYAEASFSQVMGLIEFLGFKDSKSTLQVLRSRTGLGGDDFQRCYNQGQFIRQMFLKQFSKFDGVLGEIMIRGGLALVETNLNTAILKDIIAKLKAHGFPKSPDDISNRVRPPMGNQFKVYDFTSESTIKSLRQKIERFNAERGMDTIKAVTNVSKILWSLLRSSSQDTAKRPNNVIKNLSTYFDQHAWLQVENKKERDSIREQFCILLKSAYIKKKQFDKATRVQEIIDAEKSLFHKKES